MTEFNKRIMTMEECKDFFNMTEGELLVCVDTGKSIPKGIRYWFIDEFN